MYLISESDKRRLDDLQLQTLPYHSTVSGLSSNVQDISTLNESTLPMAPSFNQSATMADATGLNVDSGLNRDATNEMNKTFEDLLQRYKTQTDVGSGLEVKRQVKQPKVKCKVKLAECKENLQKCLEMCSINKWESIVASTPKQHVTPRRQRPRKAPVRYTPPSIKRRVKRRVL